MNQQVGIKALFREAMWAQSDIREHLPLLFALGSFCPMIVEFGVRTGESTKALLAGQSTRIDSTMLYSFDVEQPKIRRSFNQEIVAPHFWYFHQADTTTLEKIPACDLLFIDTKHTREQLETELRQERHVRRWIVIHDVVFFGEIGEDGKDGILAAIDQLLDAKPEWKLRAFYHHNNGMLVIEKTKL